MTNEQTEAAEQNAETLPKQPCEGTCGRQSAYHLAQMLDGEVRALNGEALRYDRAVCSHSKCYSEVYRLQLRRNIALCIREIRRLVDQIEKTIDVETMADELSVGFTLDQGGQTTEVTEEKEGQNGLS